VRVLVANAGSSSLKLSLLGDGDQPLYSAALDAPFSDEQLRQALSGPLADAEAVGHRIVHGGERFHGPVRIEGTVESALRELTELAPLHQPRSLRALDAVSAALPGVPAVACFDTAFHHTLPAAARTYALPAEWRERWGIRRYGFHGLSHAWVARRTEQMLGRPGLRIVSCHLGAGASLCAIAGGASQDTTMGFTPLEGLVMATRSGSVDPGALTWLLERERLSPADLADALEHRSGLLGLAGSADMRTVLAAAADGEPAASHAIAVYLHRLCGQIAAMAAAIGGLDALVFTGGVGAGSAEVRARAVAGAAFLGARLDPEVNASARPDTDLSPPGAGVRTLVIEAREDLEIAGQVRDLLGGRSGA
jgi:acetate kinase